MSTIWSRGGLAAGCLLALAALPALGQDSSKEAVQFRWKLKPKEVIGYRCDVRVVESNHVFKEFEKDPRRFLKLTRDDPKQPVVLAKDSALRDTSSRDGWSRFATPAVKSARCSCSGGPARSSCSGRSNPTLRSPRPGIAASAHASISTDRIAASGTPRAYGTRPPSCSKCRAGLSGRARAGVSTFTSP
ncbi:MAG: hypothetical protein JKY65_15155 [Planctomycetes bacterium]|nr:hypothetical protein [Planctomycetota bacterium]